MLARLAIALGLVGTVAAGGLALRARMSHPYTPDATDMPDQLVPGSPDAWSILSFTAPLCVACQRTPEVIAEALGVAVEDLAAPVAGLEVHPIDVRDHPELVDHLDVGATPTVVVLDPAGQVRFAEQGNPTPEALREALPHREVAA